MLSSLYLHYVLVVIQHYIHHRKRFAEPTELWINVYLVLLVSKRQLTGLYE